MGINICLIFLLLFSSCSTSTLYVVRHAEKESSTTMTSDVPLSAAGDQRAAALRDRLKNERITAIYSTNFIRTRSTAQPLADATGVPVQVYDTRDSSFFKALKSIRKGSVLVVGHSNTVDDVVNSFFPANVIPGDLPDSSYGDLFVIRRKGNKYKLHRQHFGM